MLPGEKTFIVWYRTEYGDEDYVIENALDLDEAERKFRTHHDQSITDAHEIDWNFQLTVD